MKIAILGTRGIPGRYGGFETFAEELSVRLVAAGHEVTVYCRWGNSPGRPTSHRGVRLVHLPAIRTKYTDTLSHTLLSAIHALGQRYDIAYVCNSANAPICLIPWLRRQSTVLNVDGLEWERAKWGPLARRYYRWAARLAARLPIEIVTDAEVIRSHYLRAYGRETQCIPYGTELYERGHGSDRLGAMGLASDDYVLYVSRLEPENNALLVAEAYRQVETEVPLVIVGDAPYAQGYIERVKEVADERVRFLGYRFGQDYHALQANARLYVQATEVGGTHPALVEALGHRNAILAHDVPEHREVSREAAVYFGRRDAADLARKMSALLDDRSKIIHLRELAGLRAAQEYSWDSIASRYEAWFQQLLNA
jgi:glycosyltransferase involved in cell wall biosynthesis